MAGRSASRGFTLVEVLVALLILAVMAGMAWQGLDGMTRSRDVAQARLTATLRLQSVIAQWEADLAAVRDTGVVPALQYDGATLRLTRRVAGGVQLIAWSLRPGADGAGTWQRWAGPVTTRLDDLREAWLRSQQLLGNEPGQLVAERGVAGWQLYCWRSGAWSNCQSSGDVATTAASAAPGVVPPLQATRQLLPGGVRLVLTFAEGSGMAGRLTRDVVLAPQFAQ
ncbi:MAG: PulJ/GspJ family protein [Pseudomonadota bacterium]